VSSRSRPCDSSGRIARGPDGRELVLRDQLAGIAVVRVWPVNSSNRMQPSRRCRCGDRPSHSTCTARRHVHRRAKHHRGVVRTLPESWHRQLRDAEVEIFTRSPPCTAGSGRGRCVGLESRWTMPLRCAAPSAAVTWRQMRSRARREAPSRLIRAPGLAGEHSIAMYTVPSARVLCRRPDRTRTPSDSRVLIFAAERAPGGTLDELRARQVLRPQELRATRDRARDHGRRRARQAALAELAQHS